VWNKRVDRRPALIARCTDVADVPQALRFARQQDAVVATNRRNGSPTPTARTRWPGSPPSSALDPTNVFRLNKNIQP